MKKTLYTVLVIDAGGRGSALVDGYSRSKYVKKILAIPGNNLMKVGNKKTVITFPHLKTTSVREIIQICKREKVSLVNVAQDNAVAMGLVDKLQENSFPVVGPTKLAGQIEWDKAWARKFMKKYHIPQPIFKICHSPKEGLDYIKLHPNKQWFIKASGLAGGKGALPAKNDIEARKAIRTMSKFGESGEIFLIEQWLQSDTHIVPEEFSIFIVTDGSSHKIIGTAQDHKRAFNFDEGENTGGMGCISSPSILTPKLMKQIDRTIIKPTIEGLKKEGRPYTGILYLGGILISQKNKLVPYVIEYNARWGDPEAQCILPGIKTDMIDIDMAILDKTIDTLSLEFDGKSRIVVAGVSRGYPGNYDDVVGKQIYGIDRAQKVKGVTLYGSGVVVKNKKYYAKDGRLFYIVGEGRSVIDARQKAYAAMSLVHIEGNNLHYRTDIGWKDVEKLIG